MCIFIDLLFLEVIFYSYELKSAINSQSIPFPLVVSFLFHPAQFLKEIDKQTGGIHGIKFSNIRFLAVDLY